MVALVVAVLGCAVLCGALILYVYISAQARGKRSSWASWRLALQPIGGRGEGKGAFVGYVGGGGAGGKPSPAQKVQSSNKRDRGTTAAQAAGSWLKKIGTRHCLATSQLTYIHDHLE